MQSAAEHLPPTQARLQHSVADEHASAAVLQLLVTPAQRPVLASQLAEQHSALAAQACPPPLQVAPSASVEPSPSGEMKPSADPSSALPSVTSPAAGVESSLLPQAANVVARDANPMTTKTAPSDLSRMSTSALHSTEAAEQREEIHALSNK